MANNEYREPHETAREAGLKARQETRQERAIRRHVAEEIAAEADRIAEAFQADALAHRDLSEKHGRTTPRGERHMRTAHAFRDKADGAWAVAHAAREIGSKGGEQ